MLRTQFPEILLRASEELVRQGQPITVLGPESEFLPGTLRSNFAWDASDEGEYHFANLMELIGLTYWRERFGDSLNYQIGPDNQVSHPQRQLRWQSLERWHKVRIR